LSIMRALPNVAMYSPSDHVTAAALFDRCVEKTGPKYLRFDAQVLPVVYETEAPDLARGFSVHRRGGDACFIATGFMLHTALKVADQLAAAGVKAGVVDLFDITGFSADALQEALGAYPGIVTMEEGFRGRGGIDSMLFEFLSRRGLKHRMLNIGVEGRYRFELGTRADLHEQVGIGPAAVFKSVSDFLKTLSSPSESLPG
jgi:transketolase